MSRGKRRKKSLGKIIRVIEGEVLLREITFFDGLPIKKNEKLLILIKRKYIRRKK